MLDSFLLTRLKKTNYPLYVLWRAILHVASSLVLLFVSHLVALEYGYNAPAYVFAALLIFITYLEFYLHPKLYHQKLSKGIIDWLSWILPFILYFLFLGIL